MEAAAARQASMRSGADHPRSPGERLVLFGGMVRPGHAAAARPQSTVHRCRNRRQSLADPRLRGAPSIESGALIKAVMRQESGFKPCAISAKGAMGLMQIMPETAQSLKDRITRLDPAQEHRGRRHRYRERRYLTRFKGDLRLALAAYNAGPEKVDGKLEARCSLIYPRPATMSTVSPTRCMASRRE